MDHTVLILQRSFDPQKAVARHRHSILFKHIGRKNDVGNSGFVFEREKDKSLRRPWPLPCNHASGNAHALIPAQLLKLLRGEDALLPQRRAVIRHGVWASRQPGASIVCSQPLVRRHLLQRRAVRAGLRQTRVSQ